MKLSDVILRGTTASKPAATAVPIGAIYYDTTLSTTSRSNGTTWDDISDGGSGINQLTGDVTAGPGSGSQAATIANAAVTYAKIQNISATNRLLGRKTVGAGSVEEITVTGDLVQSGSNLVIANSAVTLAKIANAVANSKLVGSGDAGIGAAYSEITLGANLSMSGTTLSASGGGSGALTLVEHKLITADAQSYTFSGLDGNTDGIYKLILNILNGGSTSFYTIQPNAITTNQFFNRSYSDGSTTALATGATLQFGFSVTTGIVQAIIELYARNNPNSVAMQRLYHACFTNYTKTSPDTNQGIYGGRWNETATNITSIVVTGDQADSLKSGSELFLYKYGQ